VNAFEERLRQTLPPKFAGSSFSFEPGDLVSQIMNFAAPTPVEVAVIGPDLSASRAYADRLRNEMDKIADLRDLKYELPLDYPSVDVKVDRALAGQLGVTTGQVARSEATYSSRFTSPNYWADPKTGIAYQVQVQYPQPSITSLQDVQNIPVMPGQSQHPLIGDLASVGTGTIMGEYDRRNGFRMLSLSANVAGEDLSGIAKSIDGAIPRAGAPPTGTSVQLRGQIPTMHDTLTNLGVGLLLEILAIFLLLAANYESLRLSFVVLTTAPATVCGVILMLLITHTTLSIESYMGAIMAVGGHGQRHPSGDVCRSASAKRRSCHRIRNSGSEGTHASHPDDQRRHDCRHDSYGGGHGGHRTARQGGNRRSGRSNGRQFDGAAVCVFDCAGKSQHLISVT
jgi:multidrug efflux pump subunit AcrB